MKTITHELGTKVIDGKLTKVVRNYFVYEKPFDWFKSSHGEFTKEERKLAKLNHKKQ